MGILRLEKYCVCVDLKTGNMILGIINAVLSFTLFISMIVAAVEFGAMASPTASSIWFLSEEEDAKVIAKLIGLCAMSVTLVVMFLAKFLFDLFFIYGVHMERTGIIKAYYIMWIVFFLLSMFVFFCNFYYYGIKTICTEVFYIVINIFMALVSYCHYVKINMREDVKV